MRGTCRFCYRAVLWVETRAGRRIPLDPAPSPEGGFIPLRGRAWEAWELREAGEPWCDFADAPGHRNHIITCKSWPRNEPPRPRTVVYRPELACHCCGTIDETVRHVTPDLDLCSGCRVGLPRRDTPPDDRPPVTPATATQPR